MAARALSAYDLSPEATPELVNVSENTTYRVDDPATGRRAALRVHRLDYHGRGEIESELDWVEALAADGVVETPPVVRARDGSRVVTVATDELADPRYVVLFDWLEGDAPREDDVAQFRRLGALTARLHAHARAWRRPAGFARFTWDYETTLGPAARWGRWQDGLGIGREELDLLGRLDGALRRRLEAYGAAADRFGLVHADLRLANLLVAGERTAVIDFDDAGLSWFMYDWGTAVSFIEHLPTVPEMQSAWVDGYRGVAPLAAADEAELGTFVLLRRLLLVAWVGSHHAYAPEAAELGAPFTAGTCELAERFLAGRG
ncbi:MAG: phosphotransferase [Thermoleophilia bacterium]